MQNHICKNSDIFHKPIDWSHEPVTIQSFIKMAYETFYEWCTKLLAIKGLPSFEQSHTLTDPSLDVDTRTFLFGCNLTLLVSSIWAVNYIYLVVFLVFWLYSYHPTVPRSVATNTLPGNTSKFVVQS